MNSYPQHTRIIDLSANEVIDAIADRVFEKMQAAKSAEKEKPLTVSEICEAMGWGDKQWFFRRKKKYRLKSVTRGRYLLSEIKNLIK